MEERQSLLHFSLSFHCLLLPLVVHFFFVSSFMWHWDCFLADANENEILLRERFDLPKRCCNSEPLSFRHVLCCHFSIIIVNLFDFYSIRLHPVIIFANFKRFVVITSLILEAIYTEFRMRVSLCDRQRLRCSDRTIINPFNFPAQRDENHSSNWRISIQLIIDFFWLIRDHFSTPNPCMHSTVCGEDDLQFYWYPDYR